MLSDGIVKVGIPFGISILSSVGLSFEDISLARESVKMEVLLHNVRKSLVLLIQAHLLGQRYGRIHWLCWAIRVRRHFFECEWTWTYCLISVMIGTDIVVQDTIDY